MSPKLHNVIIGVIVFIAGIFVGSAFFTDNKTVNDKTSISTQAQSESQSAQIWTCSMHPQVRLPEPGQCPICFMDLILLEESESSEEETDATLKLSERAAKLAEIQTVPAERRYVSANIRMVGKIDYDEKRVKYISAWFPGRIERLYVDYTGIPVKKGEHLLEIYSPEILTTQQELLQALKTSEKLKSSPVESIRRTAEANIDAAREKLRLWGLTEWQIDNIVKRGHMSDRLTVYAPISGIVIHKNATEGMYVSTGAQIYTIADLEHLWVKMEAYESDMPWLIYGQEVEFTVEAYPGETFTGRISFISPVLNDKSRTVNVRVNLRNPDGRLKPGMFVRAVVKSKLNKKGEVVSDYLAGKWISPMHPEIVKDEPGKCDICGMPLVRAETLGYAAVEELSEPPIVIPDTAPLITGKRAVVYVKKKSTGKATFVGRNVVLGPRAGHYYIVSAGLEEGEAVVVKGNFKIDSALQIAAKPSMMNPTDNTVQMPDEEPADIDKGPMVHAPEKFRKQLGKVLKTYFSLQTALAGDDKTDAVKTLKQTKSAVEEVDGDLIQAPHDKHWQMEAKNLDKSLKMMQEAEDLEGLREGFSQLSEALTAAIKGFGFAMEGDVYQIHCPMAFDYRGADWLQSEKKTLNPYFGASMLRCGSVVDTISGTH